MKRILALIILSIFFIPPSSPAAFEIAAGAWLQSPEGVISYKALSADDLIDLEKDMRYDDETRFHGRIKMELPLFLPNIYLVAAPMEFEGTGQKDVNFTFGDENFSASTDFYSKLRLDQYDIGLYYGLPFVKTATTGMLNVDLGINVRIADLEARIRQDATGLSEKKSVTLPIPMVYAAVQLTPLEWLVLEAEARGISYSGNSLYSLTGRVKWMVFGPVFVSAGYRYDKVEIDEEDIEADIEFSGPVFEAGFKF